MGTMITHWCETLRSASTGVTTGKVRKPLALCPLRLKNAGSVCNKSFRPGFGQNDLPD